MEEEEDDDDLDRDCCSATRFFALSWHFSSFWTKNWHGCRGCGGCDDEEDDDVAAQVIDGGGGGSGGNELAMVAHRLAANSGDSLSTSTNRKFVEDGYHFAPWAVEPFAQLAKIWSKQFV